MAKYIKWLKRIEYIRLYASLFPMTLQGYEMFSKGEQEFKDTEKLMNGTILIWYAGLTSIVRLWVFTDPLILGVFYYYNQGSFLQAINGVFISKN